MLTVLLLILGGLMLPSSILLAAGMLPTLVAVLTDLDPRKSLAMSVGTVNFCGVLPFEIALWRGGHTLSHAERMLMNIETWAGMFGAATLGAVIYYAVPPVVAAFIAFRSQAVIHELERRQKALRESWGNDVA